ncbi:MAG TPA: MG2 domain-containing protein, partial [Bryobacteraceae bacterium]|nr:MG2 domain-containing protein [Bryobacteraceae bacterium]
MKRPFVWCTPLIVIAAAVLLLSFQAPQRIKTDSVSATYSQGILRATIPYDAPHAGAGQLTVEILDPEDQTFARLEQHVEIDAGKGVWQEHVKLTKTIATDELVWHRLRYRFIYSGQQEPAIKGLHSVSQILRMPVMHVLGQQSYLAGGLAAVRVIVTDSKNDIIAGPSSLRIELLPPDQKARVLFNGSLNRRGTTEAQLRFPSTMTGRYALHYVVDTPIGSTEITQPVQLTDKASILLTTEKPIYRPGQTIHVRALALDRSNHEATAGRKLTFEVEDSRGNKVFKQSTQSSKFGIASAEFALADEVNLGTYHVRAIMETSEGQSSNTSELAFNVEKYVLPKFKVAIDFAGKDQQSRHGYRPGDHVVGTVRANYFFGKPVDRAELTIKASGMDVAVVDVASVEGKTDADGAYRFDVKLPNYFAGRPLNQGAARVLIEATVKDSAGHAETRGEPITVSESPLIVTAVPEGGTLIPGLENQVFVLTSYADGKPASAELKILGGASLDKTATTDAGGVAIIRLKPDSSTQPLQIEATDKEGNHASGLVQLQVRPNEDQILLRTEHAIYHAGDRIQLRIFSTKDRGTAYVDVVKEGQTILTRDLDLKNGQDELAIAATPEMAGALDFNAYQFGPDARPAADHRLIFVQPADELKIDASTNAPVYKPGEDARIRFRVTNSHGEGVQAALGVQVVDEAVFALAEKRPGFAKVFFYLEEEALKPRYEIHSIGMSDIVEPVEQARASQHDQAARALFAATEVVNANKFDTEAGRTLPQTKYAPYWTRYRTRFISQIGHLSPRVLAKAGGLELRDAWDTKLRVEDVAWDPRHGHYLVRSAGPDQRFDTADDLTAYVEIRSRTIVDYPTLQSFDLQTEHDRGPFNGLAEIAGTVMDQSGATIPRATLEVRDVATRKTRRVSANAAGQFNLAGLPPGDYDIQVSSAGFHTASRRITIVARDRAVCSVVLYV